MDMTLLNRADQLKAEIDQHRPLNEHELKELDAYFKIGSTYTSNALEGNTLTLSETKVVIEDGLTVGGKPLRDCYEAIGHANAYDRMLQLARRENLEVTEPIICELHRLFYGGIDMSAAGVYRNHQVIITGTDYLPPTPADVPLQMHEFVKDLKQIQSKIHPILLAAYAHRRLVDIHPFADGNGRTARLLMNLILVNRGYCVVSIPPVLRVDYINALHEAQRAENPSDDSFFRLVCSCEIEAEKDYCRLLRIPIPPLTAKPCSFDIPEL